MPEQPKPDKTLSEISHLFLSSVRERQTRGSARPIRKPPAATVAVEPTADPDAATVDLTPEEVAGVIAPSACRGTSTLGVPVAAILASHLGPAQSQRAREYAAHVAGSGERVAMIELDGSEFRLWSFESAPSVAGDGFSAQRETLDARAMNEALAELAHDVDRWLVLISTPRSSEARALLRQIQNWVLLASCDDDGIVAAYRTVKGMCQALQRSEADASMPHLSLALLNAPDAKAAEKIFGKFAGVCEQFLHWHVDPHGPIVKPGRAGEHLVLSCRGTFDKAQLAAAPQWKIVSDFFEQIHTIDPKPMQTERLHDVAAESTLRAVSADSADSAPIEPPTGLHVAHDVETSDVLDLPGADSSPEQIVAAILRHSRDWVACPVRPPMAENATLAVSRQRRLALIAVARQGLKDLRPIALAYRWLVENRSLVSMAMPQFAIDAHQLPQLNLLVDHADMTADLLQPLLQSSNVTVQAYRKLRWGAKVGLLLEAA